ncbi:plasminogen activator inhibitor 1 RNA-binding protein [Chanos chanos]|uniref:Plasminogen activator inhibitor 1 RNA-binding protein n=1 Tax=Chanos chanos TaxID=29144 RepID=A0A6J2UUZ1_CHACN|nr:plasminogen activator inhibitor 1 RNA-binding protein-like [Chanos chanos]
MKDLSEDSSGKLDNGYGCAITNRFGQLLGDESDPFDILHEAQLEVQQKKKKDVANKASSNKAGKKESQRERRTLVPITGQKSSAQVEIVSQERGGKRVTFKDRKPNAKDDSVGFSIERPSDQIDRAGRGSGRGRGGRGGGFFKSTDGFDQRGKREFERHSGSDRASVRAEEKRRGSGPHNWGSMRDQMSAVVDGEPSDEVGDDIQAPDADGENHPPEAEAVVEVAIEMSLDEWKALQEQNRPKKEFNIRKADTSVPSKAVVIHKSKHIEGNSESEIVVYRRPANDITSQLEINFGDLARPFRGGRGGRGGRGRGNFAPQTERSPQKFMEVVPNPNDPEDFPALA